MSADDPNSELVTARRCKRCGGGGVDYMARPGVNLFEGKRPWERLRQVPCPDCRRSVAP